MRRLLNVVKTGLRKRAGFPIREQHALEGRVQRPVTIFEFTRGFGAGVIHQQGADFRVVDGEAWFGASEFRAHLEKASRAGQSVSWKGLSSVLGADHAGLEPEEARGT